MLQFGLKANAVIERVLRHDACRPEESRMRVGSQAEDGDPPRVNIAFPSCLVSAPLIPSVNP